MGSVADLGFWVKPLSLEIYVKVECSSLPLLGLFHNASTVTKSLFSAEKELQDDRVTNR